VVGPRGSSMSIHRWVVGSGVVVGGMYAYVYVFVYSTYAWNQKNSILKSSLTFLRLIMMSPPSLPIFCLLFVFSWL